jgi:lipoate-protein ligase A
MRLIELSLPTPAENLALDEALLEEAEAAPEPAETLRLWEPAEPLVVLGRSSHLAAEVHVAECRKRQIPILRRSSGGASIVTGPGCLMYAVVLSYHLRPQLRSLDEAHRCVLKTIAAGLAHLAPAIGQAGTSDLALAGRKFSGNSVRCKRGHLLYHGTLLYGFPLELIGTCLAPPPREPVYRQSRPHESFVSNLRASAAELRAALVAAWGATPGDAGWPRERVAQLVESKYGRDEWNFGR